MSHDESLVPSDEAAAAARKRVDELLAGSGLDLGEASLWEPARDLEDRIMTEAAGVAGPTRPSRWGTMIAAAAVILMIGVAGFAALRSTGPDWSVALAATDLAPNAVAAIDGWNEPSGTRIVLDIQGLEPAPRGYFYELWFSDGPVHISAGTFRIADGVELWAGVPRSDFPRLWITLEPIDDNESPSQDTVLDTG